MKALRGIDVIIGTWMKETDTRRTDTTTITGTAGRMNGTDTMPNVTAVTCAHPRPMAGLRLLTRRGGARPTHGALPRRRPTYGVPLPRHTRRRATIGGNRGMVHRPLHGRQGTVHHEDPDTSKAGVEERQKDILEGGAPAFQLVHCKSMICFDTQTRVTLKFLINTSQVRVA